MLQIKKYRKLLGWTLDQLAERTGYSKSQLSRWENNSRSPDFAQMTVLAEALGVTMRHLLPDDLVPVVGRVGAGQQVYSIDDHPPGEGLYDVPCPDGLDPIFTWAVEVEGDSMLPIQPGWLLFVARNTPAPADEFLGKLCLVKTALGAYYVKNVRPGYDRGTYNLLSSNAAPIENTEIEWAYPVQAMTPRPDPSYEDVANSGKSKS